MWVQHNNITLPEPLYSTLVSTKLFSSSQIDEILTAAKDQAWKDRLSASTKKVLHQGAFGAPWMWVRNKEGVEEPFFGSDRYVLIERGDEWGRKGLMK